jgi:hypothetical protein
MTGVGWTTADMCPSMGIVLLQDRLESVARVPLLNFQTFAPGMVDDLVEISETKKTRRWRFHTYDVGAQVCKRSIEQWASWLTHRHLRAVIDDGPGDETGDRICFALLEAHRIGDLNYRDALVDAWIQWLQNGEPAGSLNVDRLQDQSCAGYADRLDELICALILYHDASTVLDEDTGKSDEEFPYDASMCRAVRDLALTHFALLETKPTDPLQLSQDEFCERYHNHHFENWPCYRTKKLPEQSQV